MRRDRIWDWSVVLVWGSLIAAIAALAGCTPLPKPAPTTRVFDVVLCADGPDEQHSEQFTCTQRIAGRVSAETATDVWKASDTDTAGYVLFAAPPVPAITRLKLEASGYETRFIQGFHFEACAEGCHNVYRLTSLTPPPPPLPTYPFQAEAGRLTIRGKHFYDEAGNVWGWRGGSMFLLHARFFRGEDITAQLEWLRKTGMNVARVFLRVPWGGEWEFYRTPENDPRYLPSLHAFIDLCAAHGLRVELVPLTYEDSAAKQRARVQQIFDIAAGHWNVFVEVANEPHVNGIEPQIALEGVDRHGVLYATGAYSEKQELVTVGDYVTDHTPRVEHWVRLARWIQEDQERYFRPAVGDEPFGAGEQDKNGSGARRTSTADFAGYFAICAELAAGCTLHTQAGLEGRAPSAAEPVQQAIATTTLQVWQFIPPAAQTCAYSAPHLTSTWPVTWTPGDTDSTLEHAYAAVCPGSSWVVVPRPRAGYVLTPVNGWRVAEVGPFPWMARLER